MRRILFVINPSAGTRNKQNLEVFLSRKAEEAGFVYSMFHLGKSMNRYSLLFAAEEFEATELIAIGGDGTINLVAQCCIELGIPLGMIPVGSGNGLARSAKIPMRPLDAWQVIAQAKTLVIDSFTVQDKPAFLLSGLGMDAKVAEQFSNSRQRGLLVYTRETLRAFFKALPFSFEITIDGFTFFSQAYFVSVANSNQFGNNVKIAPLASLHDGKLDVVIVQDMPKLSLPFALFQQLNGGNAVQSVAQKIASQSILYFQAAQVLIKNLQQAPLHIDGDPAETATDVSFAVRPGSLKIFAP